MMLTIEELYKKIVRSAETKEIDSDLEQLRYDPFHLECILKPEMKRKQWDYSGCGHDFITCLFKNLTADETGNYIFEKKDEKCLSCIDIDTVNKVTASKDSMTVLSAIRDGKRPVIAAIAPAFLSQFDTITDGQLRSAFKQIGFAGMVEVSLFADILTLKEALEFEQNIKSPDDFLLTSCCCPLWVGLIRKHHPHLLEHVPKAVSPMIASGRVIRELIPNAFTVFIGPCLAKKAEAKEADIDDAIDVVLTFREIKDIFSAAKIDGNNLPEDLREHSSTGGRRYATTGGVSYAVESTVRRLHPDKPIPV
jgi:iron only hydrogenase large subunit-like protein